MPMAPNEIKAALALRGVKQLEIARAVDMSPSMVNDVINGYRENAEIQREIAARIGKPVKRVFGEAA